MPRLCCGCCGSLRVFAGPEQGSRGLRQTSHSRKHVRSRSCSGCAAIRRDPAGQPLRRAQCSARGAASALGAGRQIVNPARRAQAAARRGAQEQGGVVPGYPFKVSDALLQASAAGCPAPRGFVGPRQAPGGVRKAQLENAAAARGRGALGEDAGGVGVRWPPLLPPADPALYCCLQVWPRQGEGIQHHRAGL